MSLNYLSTKCILKAENTLKFHISIHTTILNVLHEPENQSVYHNGNNMSKIRLHFADGIVNIV